MQQSQIRLNHSAYKKSLVIFRQKKQKVIKKCKHCDLAAVKAKTPSGTTLYYCANKNCNFSGMIVNKINKKNKEDRFLYY